MFSRIIAAILAFFALLFPGLQKTKPLDNEVVANTVISALKTNDIAALEALMCKNIKQNVPDLRGEIGRLLDTIDGEEFEFSWGKSGGYSESSGRGKSISQNYLDIHIQNSTKHYLLIIVLETYNSFAPEEMGIRYISVAPKTTPVSNALYTIQATEGVMEWHN